MEITPNWTVLRYNDARINLANNICYDEILLNDVQKLLCSSTLELRQYPDEAIAYSALSKYHNIDSKNIAIGYGIGELIVRILRLEQLRSISILSPTWPMVEIFSQLNDIEYTTEINESTDAIYIANPSGVNGECLSVDEILSYTKKFNLVIVDEAYGNFARKEFSVLDKACELDNLIVLKTFSKSLSLAGLRFGYAISNKNIINELQLNRPSCIINGSIINIISDLLNMIPDHVNRMNETKDYIQSKYDCIETHGNYVIFKDIPSNLDNHFILKETSYGIRMALLNLHLLKRLGY